MIEAKVVHKVETQSTGNVIQLTGHKQEMLHILHHKLNVDMHLLDDESAQMLLENAQPCRVKSGYLNQ